MPSPTPDHSSATQSLAGHLVVFTGKLTSLPRKDAHALVARLGGATADAVDGSTTILVVGRDGGSAAERAQRLRKVEELNAQSAPAIEILTEDEFCRRVGVPTLESLKSQYNALRDLLARYRTLREDHVRYLIKWNLVTPAVKTAADTFFAFSDVAVIKQANDALEQGMSFRSVVRALLAAKQGQLTFDFRHENVPARVIALQPKAPPPAPRPDARPARDTALAEEYFLAGSALDNGEESTRDQAAQAYRRALELDPYLVAALINLANIHYSRDELVEAQALYERAIGLESDFFEAHFNLGNIYHDLGRFPEAQACYEEALRLNPRYADTRFYLAVTLEKMGLSQEARPHWRAYQQLAPKGEWVELAKEFSE